MLSKQACQVLATFIYSSLFNYPLTAKEAELRLFAAKQLSSIGLKKTVNNQKSKQVQRKTKTIIQELVKSGDLIKKSLNQTNYYFPAKFISGQIDPFVLRKQKEVWAKKLKKDLPILVTLMKKISWVRGVAVTGSLALDSGWKNDDIDLMVIARKNRLWLSRTIVLLSSLIRGKKGFLNKEQDWCFNLWLEADSLALSAKRQNPYIAYEVLQADWICESGGLEEKFLKSNSWVKEYFPNYYLARLKQVKSAKFAQLNSKSFKPIGCFLDLLNGFLFLIQSTYINIKLKIPWENLKRKQAFFHRKASGQEILIRLKRRLRTYSNQLFSK